MSSTNMLSSIRRFKEVWRLRLSNTNMTYRKAEFAMNGGRYESLSNLLLIFIKFISLNYASIAFRSVGC